MAGKRHRSRTGGRGRSGTKGRTRTVSEGVRVSAVRASSGRAATTVDVEVETARLERQVDRLGGVEEVDAVIPSAGEGEEVRWEEQRLEKTGEDLRPDGERTLRYSGTRYDGNDVGRYGIGARLKTSGGTIETPHVGKVRESDKPGDDEGAPVDD